MLDVDCLTGARWTEAELAHLRSKHGHVSDNALAADLRRSLGSIRKRVTIERRLGRMPRRTTKNGRTASGVFRPRNPAVVAQVMESRSRQTYREIAGSLGITISTVAGIVRDHRSRISP